MRGISKQPDTMQACVQRLASTEPAAAIDSVDSYAFYATTISLGSALGMPEQMEFNKSGIGEHYSARRATMKGGQWIGDLLGWL